ncbi:hypothetical protein TNCV_3637141 [Trichonephila clavipes]|nr:hypothetical protein TNCV_3637141 [Trichonephila clavipes]
MDLRKWRTNSSELNQRLKNLNFEVDEHKESLNTLIASKVLGVGWNEKSDTFYLDSSDLGTFLSKRINTKGYLLQATGRLFDPGGRLKHSTLSEFQKHQMMLPKATNFKGARNILNEWNAKFASPTEFSYSARKRESNGTSFHPLLPISVDCGKQTLSP